MTDQPGPFRFRRRLLVSSGLLCVLFCIVLAAPLLAPYDPDTTDLSRTFEPPSLSHPAGTDRYGRDILSRLIWGGRTSLSVALSATAFALSGGLLLGIVAGAGPRRLDLLLNLAITTALIFPGFVLAMVLVAVLGSTPPIIALAIGAAFLPRVALVVRAAALEMAAAPHIEAAVAIGASPLGVLRRSVLPGVMPTAIVLAGTIAGNALIAEAGLSFLGIGVRPPAPSWGSLIAEAGTALAAHPWLSLGPGLCITATVFAVNLLSDALYERLTDQGYSATQP